MTEIDFHRVEEHQQGIHTRLLNWARWCHGRDGQSGACSPMWNLSHTPPGARAEYAMSTPSPVDKMDAQAMAKGVAALPSMHRALVQWAYVKPIAPRRVAKELGLSFAGMYQLLRDGRQMLINRGV